MCFPKTKFRVLFGPTTVFPDLAPASSWTRAPFTPRERLLACSVRCLPRPQEPRLRPLPVSQLRLRLRLSRCWAWPLSIYFPSVSCFSSVDVLCGPFRILLSYCLVFFLSHVCQFPLLSLNKVILHTTANGTEVSVIPRNMCTCTRVHTVYSQHMHTQHVHTQHKHTYAHNALTQHTHAHITYAHKSAHTCAHTTQCTHTTHIRMRTHTTRACSHALTTHAYTCARTPVHTQHVHTYAPNTEMGSLLARSFAARFLQVTLQGRPGRLPLCRGCGREGCARRHGAAV